MKTLFKCIVGSRLYGINTPESDTDIKGFGLPPYNNIIGLREIEQEEFKDADTKTEGTIYTVKKFLQLCSKGNPTVLELAFVTRPEHIIEQTEIGKEICKFVRDNCVSECVFYAYRNYFQDQVRKLQRERREGKRQEFIDKYGYDVKFAAHAMRLAIQCNDIITTGTLDPTLDKAGKKLVLDIRNGVYDYDKVLALLISAGIDLDKTWESSIIREKRVDLEKVDQFLCDIHINYLLESFKVKHV